MNLEQFAIAGASIVGLVNGVQFAVQKNWVSFTYFMVALIAGSVFGALNWFGLPSLEMGFALGLSSSGVYKGVQVLSGR